MWLKSFWCFTNVLERLKPEWKCCKPKPTDQKLVFKHLSQYVSGALKGNIFTVLVFLKIILYKCLTQELAKKPHVNDEYNIYSLLVKIYYLQLPILNIMLVWLKRHWCDSSFKSTQHFRHSIISIMTKFGQLVRHTHFR